MANDPKSGWKTTEFWLSLVAIAAGLVPTLGVQEGHWAVKVAAVVAFILAALGYTYARSKVKVAEVLKVDQAAVDNLKSILEAKKAAPTDAP